MKTYEISRIVAKPRNNNPIRIYELLKRLRKKNHKITKKAETDVTNPEDKMEPKAA